MVMFAPKSELQVVNDDLSQPSADEKEALWFSGGTEMQPGVNAPKLVSFSKSWGLRLVILGSVMAAVEGNAWHQLSPGGSSPGSRMGSSAVWSAADKRMYFFGGQEHDSLSEPTYFNDLRYYEAEANTWTSVSPGGTTPTARSAHTMVWSETHRKMWVFAGYISGYSVLNDLHCYDEEANTWTSVSPGGATPTARAGHAAVWSEADRKMWVFSGVDLNGNRLNDLLCYDEEANSWTSLSPGGIEPTGRFYHTAVWSEADRKMWIFGGAGDVMLNDLLYYDAQANTWTSLSPSGTLPSERTGAVGVWSDADSKMWIFGGTPDGTDYLNDLHRYDAQANTWSSVAPSGAAPAGRAYHMSVFNAEDSRIYVHAGQGSAVGDVGDELYYYDAKVTSTTSTGTTTSTSTTTRSSTSTSSSSTSSTTSRSTSSSTSSTTSRSTSSSTSSTISDTSTTTSSASSMASSSNTGTTTSTSTSTSSASSTASSTTTGTSTSTSSASSTASSTTTASSTGTSTTSKTASSTSSTSRSSTSSRTSSSVTTTSSTRSTSTTSSTSSTSITSTTTTASTTTATSQTTSTTTGTSTATVSTSATTTSVSTSFTRTTFTTTTETLTTFPAELTREELKELETQRKKEAEEAVKAVEDAESEVVEEAIDALLANSSNTSRTPGVLGEILVETSAGPVKVAALSLDSLAEADGLATVTTDEDTGAAVEITTALLGEVAKASGSGNDTILLSVVVLSKSASASLKADNVLAEPPVGHKRRLAGTASALQSRPVSVSFLTANGTKLSVSNLAKPMQIVLQVENPNATCAFWDEDTAQWSSEGVETLPHKVPGTILCSTRHLTIFGGVVDVFLRNVVLALECSTVSALVNIAALRKIAEPKWLERPAAILMISTFAASLIALAVAARADRRLITTFPLADREHLLMRVKVVEEPQEEPEQKDETEASAASDERADENGSKASRESGDKEKKETAAGGDFELPSIFRALRGLVEGMLDAMNQMTGGEGFLEEIKEVVSNAEAGSIHRAIGMVQAQRSGADQTTIQALHRTEVLDDDGRQTQPSRDDAEDVEAGAGAAKMEAGSRKLPANSLQAGQSAAGSAFASLNVPSDALGAESRRPHTSIQTIEVQSVNSQDFEVTQNRRSGAQLNGGEGRGSRMQKMSVKSQDSDAAQNRRSGASWLHGGEGRGSRLQGMRVTVVNAIGGAVAAARRGGSEMLQKVRILRGHVTQSGSGAAERYLNSNVFCRTWILLPAAHNWIKLGQMSIAVSYAARVELIYLKMLSAAMLNAVFFSASSLTEDSDPGCTPDKGSAESWMQKITVGLVSALFGDFVIFLLFLLVRKSASEEVEWTEEKKSLRRRRWKRRAYFFWIFTVFYVAALHVYTYLFLANVSEADAQKWLESTAVSLLQDMTLKPILLALILSIMSSLVLNCRPDVKRKIHERWIREEAEDAANLQDLRESVSSFAEAETGCQRAERYSDRSQRRSYRTQRRSDRRSFASILPGTALGKGRASRSKSQLLSALGFIH